jgi:hypothetical protein
MLVPVGQLSQLVVLSQFWYFPCGHLVQLGWSLATWKYCAGQSEHSLFSTIK